MNRGTRKQRGNTIVEFAIVLAPMLFLMLSVMELSRSMWMYHTLTTAVKSGTRYVSLHGSECVQAAASCQTTIREVANVVRQSGIGLMPESLRLTLTAGTAVHQCQTLTGCLESNVAWPPAPNNTPGATVKIQAAYSFQSVLNSFWPGGGPASMTYKATSAETIQF